MLKCAFDKNMRLCYTNFQKTLNYKKFELISGQLIEQVNIPGSCKQQTLPGKITFFHVFAKGAEGMESLQVVGTESETSPPFPSRMHIIISHSFPIHNAESFPNLSIRR